MTLAMLKIIERTNGSVIFIGFYQKGAGDADIDKLRKGIESLCVETHKDRAIIVPEGTDVETFLQGK